MLGPVAVAQAPVGYQDLTGQRQHQAKSQLRHRPGARSRDSDQFEVPPPDAIQVDVVQAGAGTHQKLQLRRGLQDPDGDLHPAPENKHFPVPDQSHQVPLAGVETADEVVPCVQFGQRLLGNPTGDQNFYGIPLFIRTRSLSRVLLRRSFLLQKRRTALCRSPQKGPGSLQLNRA